MKGHNEENQSPFIPNVPIYLAPLPYKGFVYVTSPYVNYFWQHSPYNFSPLKPFVSFGPPMMKNQKGTLSISKKPATTIVESSKSTFSRASQNFVSKSEPKGVEFVSIES